MNNTYRIEQCPKCRGEGMVLVRPDWIQIATLLACSG